MCLGEPMITLRKIGADYLYKKDMVVSMYVKIDQAFWGVTDQIRGDGKNVVDLTLANFGIEL
jgi:hypothetical protein